MFLQIGAPQPCRCHATAGAQVRAETLPGPSVSGKRPRVSPRFPEHLRRWSPALVGPTCKSPCGSGNNRIAAHWTLSSRLLPNEMALWSLVYDVLADKQGSEIRFFFSSQTNFIWAITDQPQNKLAPSTLAISFFVSFFTNCKPGWIWVNVILAVKNKFSISSQLYLKDFSSDDSSLATVRVYPQTVFVVMMGKIASALEHRKNISQHVFEQSSTNIQSQTEIQVQIYPSVRRLV